MLLVVLWNNSAYMNINELESK